MRLESSISPSACIRGRVPWWHVCRARVASLARYWQSLVILFSHLPRRSRSQAQARHYLDFAGLPPGTPTGSRASWPQNQDRGVLGNTAPFPGARVALRVSAEPWLSPPSKATDRSEEHTSELQSLR